MVGMMMRKKKKKKKRILRWVEGMGRRGRDDGGGRRRFAALGVFLFVWG